VTLLHEIPEVVERSRERQIGAGASVFSVGDTLEMVHVVHDGVLFVRSTTPDGDPAVVDVRARGDLLDDTALLPGNAPLHLDQAVALTDCVVLQIPLAAFESLRDQSVDVGAALMAQLSDQARRLSHGLVDLLGRPARARTARRIGDIARALDRSGLTSSAVVLTQHDLAEFVGTTRPTLNATLGELQAAGAVAVSRGRLSVTDVDALERFAQ
jgi:CRP-like cAMP-binding protein